MLPYKCKAEEHTVKTFCLVCIYMEQMMMIDMMDPANIIDMCNVYINHFYRTKKKYVQRLRIM